MSKRSKQANNILSLARQYVFKYKSVIFFLLGIFFIFQPLVSYLAAYDPGDCDDKAVHFFSAAYFHASAQKKLEFKNILQPFIRENQMDPGWDRTNFRIQSVNAYPLANFAIAALYKNNKQYTDIVKWGLFINILLATLLVVALSSKTPFGLWQTLLVLDLIAFYSIKMHFIIPLVPRNMHPFITYVPRGAAALLIIPAILAFASRKYYLLIISQVAMFIFHGGLAIVSLVLFTVSIIAFVIIQKFKLLNRKPFYLLPFATAALGFHTLVPSIALSSFLYLNEFYINKKHTSFYDKAFVFGCITLLSSIIISGISSNTLVSQALIKLFRISDISEIPQRLTGIQYSLLVLNAVVFARSIIDRALAKFKNVPSLNSHKISLICIGILFFLTLNHLTEYTWVKRGVTGFFLPNCTSIKPLPLPQDLDKISLGDEPTMFVSFGNYLFTDNSKH